MPEFMHACDLVCIPSRSESFGRTIIEAFATRTPVIGTRVGGIPEIIDDGENGMLTEYNDSLALARKILQLLDDPAWCAKLAQNGFEKARRLYRAEPHQDRITAIVNDLLHSVATA